MHDDVTYTGEVVEGWLAQVEELVGSWGAEEVPAHEQVAMIQAFVRDKRSDIAAARRREAEREAYRQWWEVQHFFQLGGSDEGGPGLVPER